MKRWGAWAGAIGPILFTLGFLAQEAARRGEYSPVAEPVSALEAGPSGWVQQLNFVVFGALTLAFAVGLHRGLRPSLFGWAGPTLVAVSGIGLFLAAIFPVGKDATGAMVAPAGHVASGVTFFLGSALALVVLSHRVAHDPAWRGLARYMLVAGVLAVLGFVLVGALVIPDSAPLHAWAGLGQRLLLLTLIFPARIALSIRLLRLTASADPAYSSLRINRRERPSS